MKQQKIRPIQKPHINREEMQKLEDDALRARDILKAPEYEFFRKFLLNEQNVIIKDFVTNNIFDTTQVKPLQQGGQVEIKYPKEEQRLELAGRYKLITEIFNWLEIITNLPKDAFEKEEQGILTIESKEKEKSNG